MEEKSRKEEIRLKDASRKEDIRWKETVCTGERKRSVRGREHKGIDQLEGDSTIERKRDQ